MLSAPFFKTEKEISGRKQKWSGSFSQNESGTARSVLEPAGGSFRCRNCGRQPGSKLDHHLQVHGGRADRGHLFRSQPLFAYRDPAVAIWWLCTDAIYRYNVGNYTRIALPPSFPKSYFESEIAATADGFGAFWLDALREGLFYTKKGGWQRLETAPQFAMMSPRTPYRKSQLQDCPIWG
jgi:hypothetical protein